MAGYMGLLGIRLEAVRALDVDTLLIDPLIRDSSDAHWSVGCRFSAP